MGNGSGVESWVLEISLTRRIAAAPELVFRAWTDPKHLAEWWEPKRLTNRVYKADARVGGAIRIYMPAPNGLVHAMTRRFVEIDRPHRLVFATAGIDDE